MAESDGSPAPSDVPDTEKAGVLGSRPGLVLGLIAIVVVLLGVTAALLLISGGSDNETKDAAIAASSSTTPASSITASGGATATSKASGSVAATNAPAPPPTTAKPAVTTTTLPKPTFTSSSVSPGLVTCATRGATKTLSVTWTTVNAEQVTMSVSGKAPSNWGPNPTAGVGAVYTCGQGNSIDLTASGPGGTATTTLSFNYTIVDGS